MKRPITTSPQRNGERTPPHPRPTSCRSAEVGVLRRARREGEKEAAPPPFLRPLLLWLLWDVGKREGVYVERGWRRGAVAAMPATQTQRATHTHSSAHTHPHTPRGAHSSKQKKKSRRKRGPSHTSVLPSLRKKLSWEWKRKRERERKRKDKKEEEGKGREGEKGRRWERTSDRHTDTQTRARSENRAERRRDDAPHA